MKFIKLYRIKRARSIRDELITCNNKGRARYLLMQFSNVERWEAGYTSSIEVCKYITITLFGGYEYSFTGFGPLISGYKAAGLMAYNKLAEKYTSKINNNKQNNNSLVSFFIGLSCSLLPCTFICIWLGYAEIFARLMPKANGDPFEELGMLVAMIPALITSALLAKTFLFYAHQKLKRLSK